MTIRASGRHARAAVLRFGEIARKLGYIDDSMLTDALRRQKSRIESGESHKLLGLILLELGHIDSEQLIEILKRFEADQHPHAAGA
jgi:hypothetical protein